MKTLSVAVIFFLMVLAYYLSNGPFNQNLKNDDAKKTTEKFDYSPSEIDTMNYVNGKFSKILVIKQGKDVGAFKMYLVERLFDHRTFYVPSAYSFLKNDQIILQKVRYQMNEGYYYDVLFQILPQK
jgi:hypothetical protein